MRVELDVFSGRPNPSWDISSSEVDELTRGFINAAPGSRFHVHGRLGYRGVVIREAAKRSGQAPHEIRLYHGMVEVTDEKGTRFYQDAGGMEQRLLDQCRQRGYKEVVDTLVRS